MLVEIEGFSESMTNGEQMDKLYNEHKGEPLFFHDSYPHDIGDFKGRIVDMDDCCLYIEHLEHHIDDDWEVWPGEIYDYNDEELSSMIITPLDKYQPAER